MKRLGYQLGKLLGTVVAGLINVRKGTHIAIALIGLLLIALYVVVRTSNQSLPIVPNNQPTSSSLKVGRSARVVNTAGMVNLRRSIGYLNKSDIDVIVTVPSGEVVRIIKGPEFSDHLKWWYVQWGSYEGWMAEYSGGRRLLLKLD